MTHARRVDNNHSEIMTALRDAGYYVIDISRMGSGIPDILVVSKERRVILMEIKSPGGRLTWEEAVFAEAYPGAYQVVRSAEDAIRAVEILDHVEATK